MMKPTTKNLLRTIKYSFGRYMAILLIMMLGVGIFAGLKISKDAMVAEYDSYLDETNFYDFQVISSLGLTEEDRKEFEELSEVSHAEGGFQLEAFFSFEEGETGEGQMTLRLMTVPEKINLPKLKSGKMPTAVNECVVDDKHFSEEDIGKTISISDNNLEETTEVFAETEYVITGLTQSPFHISSNRGTTTIGSGSIDGFIYTKPEALDVDYYTAIYMTLKDQNYIYSNEYETEIDGIRPEIETLLEDRVDLRYNELYGELSEEMLEQLEISDPETYTLTRNENADYVSFENDTAIVAGISYVFPIFFFLVAILICITTMARMVEEERTQIGTLKALGYSSASISIKYIAYAGSAAVFGWALGYFVGTLVIPKVIWAAYGSQYQFAPLHYIGDMPIAFGTLFASLVCSIFAVIFCCWRELSCAPAESMRPKSPNVGKRILFERIPFFWNRFSFLMKVSIRNVFRYKRRLMMMILGVSGCTALLVAGFGVQDSVQNIANYHYNEIMIYDFTVTVDKGTDKQKFFSDSGYASSDCIFTSSETAEIDSKDRSDTVYLVATEAEDFTGFINFRNDGEEISWSQKDEALISAGAAAKNDLSIGDMVALTTSNDETAEFKIGGIFDNYVGDFVYVSAKSYEKQLGEKPEMNNVYIQLPEDADSEKLASELLELPDVTSVSQRENQRNRIDDSLSSIDYIVLTIVICAGALAFIVIYNLTNINIIERTREIATIKVLGFYPKESAAYVLRENMILAGIGAGLGLVIGKYFHRLIMSMLIVNSVTFDVRVTALSYLFSFLLTMAFAVIVNLMMYAKLDKISMSESLKTVE